MAWDKEYVIQECLDALKEFDRLTANLKRSTFEADLAVVRGRGQAVMKIANECLEEGLEP